MLAIPNTTLLDGYDASTTFGGEGPFVGGAFTIANNPAAVRLLYGRQGAIVEGAELYLPPGVYPLRAGAQQPIAGLKARNFVAGAAAQLFGVLYTPGEAQIQGASAFDLTIAASGAVLGVGELAYVERVADIAVTAASTELAPLTILSLPTLTFDGATEVLLEVFAPGAANSGASDGAWNLWDDTATDIGRIASVIGGGFAPRSNGVVYGAYRFTPPAAQKTYRIRGWSVTNTMTYKAGPGGPGQWLPMFARLTTV